MNWTSIMAKRMRATIERIISADAILERCLVGWKVGELGECRERKRRECDMWKSKTMRGDWEDELREKMGMMKK